MKNPFYLTITAITLFFGCKPTDIILDQPIAELNFQSGYVYIACDGGPYYFHLDSLMATCSLNEALPEKLTTPFQETCLYDNNEGKLGDKNNHNIMFSRDSLALAFTNYQIEEIPITLDGAQLNKGEYPYYQGYKVSLEEKTLNIYLVNKYIGGCFHEMVIWQVAFTD